MTYRARIVLTLGVCSLALASRAPAGDWPQWLGPQRDGTSAELPAALPAQKLLWRQPLNGESHGGLAVAGNYLIVPDFADGQDLIRCYTADTGATVWTHRYPAAADIQFGSCMRATPLIHDGRVYTCGALGEVTCLELAPAGPAPEAKVVWRVNLAERYQATRPEWGYSASPLIVDRALILAPGAKDAAVVAVDPLTGRELWKTPGEPAAYASFALLTLGGVRQLVGYDKSSMGGWDPTTGKRLWTVKPETAGDFNVGTPLAGGPALLLVASENNGARLYRFRADGTPDAKPVATNDDLLLDMGTPVLWKGRAYATRGALTCLDLADLKTLWQNDKDDGFTGYSAAIVGNDRLLLLAENGMLFLVDIAGKEGRVLGNWQASERTWSFPALANGRFYVRDAKSLYCYEMK